MALKFNITPRAQADSYITAVSKRLQWLAQQPQTDKHRPDIEHGYYCFPQSQHLIFYLIRDNAIDIIGIPHRSMEIGIIFDE
jgi:toxin ParE1/3/4